MDTKHTATIQGGRSMDGGYGFSLSIGIGLILFLAGLVVAIFFGDENGTGLLFGIPLILAGVILPFMMMRSHFSSHEISAPCPACGTTIKTSDHTLQLDCPECGKTVLNEYGEIHLSEEPNKVKSL